MAGAAALDIVLYRHIGGASACALPVPGVISLAGSDRYGSGARSGGNPSYAFMCYGFPSFSEAPTPGGGTGAGHGRTPRGASHRISAGRCLFWHSSVWHYSPSNTSDQGRIGIAGVYTTPAIVERGKPYWPNLLWIMRDGQRRPEFPPESYPLDRALEKPPAYLKAE